MSDAADTGDVGNADSGEVSDSPRPNTRKSMWLDDGEDDVVNYSSNESDDDSDEEEEEKPKKTRTSKNSSKKSDDDSDEDDSDDEDESDEEEEEKKPKKESKKEKARKRKIKRGQKEIEVDLDDEDGILSLISDPPKYRVKIDGAESDVELEDLIADYQKAQSSYSRMREAKQLKSDFENRIGTLKGEHPKLTEFLKEAMDVDPWEVLLNEYQERLQLEELNTPDHPNYNPGEYRRRLDEQIRNEERIKLKKEQEAEKAKEQQKAIHERMKKFRGDVQTELKKRGVPLDYVTNGVLRQVAAVMEEADAGSLTPQALVKESLRYLKDTSRKLVPTDPDELAEFLGEERVKALQKRAVNQAKGGKSNSRPAGQNSSGKKPKQTSKNPTPTEAIRELRGKW